MYNLTELKGKTVSEIITNIHENGCYLLIIKFTDGTKLDVFPKIVNKWMGENINVAAIGTRIS
jgi:hypothetical protein